MDANEPSRGAVRQLLTIVFTDVVDSSATKRDRSLGRDNRERDHAYLEKIQTRHFNLVRECYAERGGREVDTMGDAFYLTFNDPVEAVRCAVDIQKQLAADPIETPRGPLRLRIGIHSGFPESFERSWHGTDVDTAARVEAAATERQILVSAPTYELVRHMTDLKFHPRGEFALKGVARTTLWEVDWDGHGPRPTAVAPLEEKKPGKLLKRVAGIAAAVALVSAGVGYRIYRGRTSRSATNTSEGFRDRRSVAVLGFKNLSGRQDEAWLSTALSEMLATELSAGQDLRTVPGEAVSQMKADLSLPDTESFAIQTLSKIRQNIDCDDVVTGSYVSLGGGEIRLDVRLQDTQAGETVASLSEKGPESRLDDLVARTGEVLREKLGARDLTSVEAAAVKASLPSDPEAARLYAEGLRKLRVFDALGARDTFEKLVRSVPKFPQGHAALASAWMALGYDARAQGEAKTAFDLSANLPREQQLAIEGRYRETTHEWAKAIEVYKSLLDFFPDDPDYGLWLAAAQTKGNQAHDALRTVQDLRKLPPPARDDPRLDLQEARAAYSLGELEQARRAAEQAASKAEKQGARLLIAQARLVQGQALLALGDPSSAIEANHEAQRIFSGAGDRGGVASALLDLGMVLSSTGDNTGAERAWEESLVISKEIGYEANIQNGLNNLATVRGDLGDLAGEERLLKESLEVSKKREDVSGVARTSSNLAGLLFRRGDLEAAKRTEENSLEVYRSIGDKVDAAGTLANLGWILLREGDLMGAQAKYQESLAIYREIGHQDGVASLLNSLGNLYYEESNLPEAKNTFEQAIVSFTQVGDKHGVQMSENNLANVLIDMGDMAGSAKHYEQALQLARESNDPSSTAQVLRDLADLAEAQGDLAAARKNDEESLKIRIALGEKGAVMDSQMALAILDLEEGHTAAAEASAREAAEEFRREKSPVDEASALAVVARALLRQGKIAAAVRTMDSAVEIAKKDAGNLSFVMPVLIEAARIHAAAGETDAAEKDLESLLEQATKLGNVELQFEARLALGEVELKAGKIADGQARLAELNKDATAKGYILIAKKAQSAQRQAPPTNS
jgi:eukaryotic-like serine/threonine-protein kinase